MDQNTTADSSVIINAAAEECPPQWKENTRSWHLVAQYATRTDAVKEFYLRQAEAIEMYLALDKQQQTYQQKLLSTAGEPIIDAKNETEPRVVTLAVQLSLALNVALCGVKLYAFAISGSLVVAASLTDSALDLLSGGILVLVSYMRQHADIAVYPTGKHRFEPLGTLVFSCIMSLASVKLIDSCIQRILTGDVALQSDPIVYIVCVTIVKFIAWMLCRRFAALSSSVEALAADHRNDAVSNAIGIAALYAASQFWAYIDPIVALLTSTAIMILWSRSAFLQVRALSGRTAPKDVINALTLVARNHDSRVIAVDTVRAVTAGDGFMVEIDLVLPPDMPLKEAHDIGESLQLFLETLQSPDVARAYVHLDYECSHDPRHHR